MAEQSIERDIRDDLRQAKAIELGRGKDPSAETTIAEWQALMFGTVDKSYDPNQPRDPAGTPTGGQWTGAGGEFPRFIGFGSDAQKKVDQWLKEHGATERRVTQTKDVTLPSGDILPNRQLTHVVYDLSDGRTVEVVSQIHGDPVGGSNKISFDIIPARVIAKYDPNQPRDWRGRWTSGGGSLEFSEAKPLEFIMARDASSRINYLSPLKPDDLRNHKLLMNKDHTVGVAISPEGDIQNVFNNGGPKGAGTIAVKSAIMHGGTTLDCYAGFLPGYYSKLGFEEVSRIKFDPQYAPPNWDYANDKMPDIVYMKLRK